MATPFVDHDYAALLLEGRQLLDSNSVLRHRVVVIPHPTAAAPPTDHDEEPCGAARGIVIGLALCAPFWVGVYLLLF